MVASNWFKDLGLTGKATLAIAGGVALTATAYGLYILYKNRLESRNLSKSEESDEEGGIPEKRILVLGLDGAGKTVFLSALSQPESSSRANTTATGGFNVVCLTTDGLNLNIWEIGGSEKNRAYWPNFIDNVNLLVYIVDSSNPDRFTESKIVLHKLLSEKKLHGVPVLLVSSKNDVSGAKPLSEVTAALGLDHDTASRNRWLAVNIQYKDNGETHGVAEARAKILALCK